jgi:hypothetical protein
MNLHRALEIRIAQLLGEKLEIWRDPKLIGNDVFEKTHALLAERTESLVSQENAKWSSIQSSDTKK